MRISFSKQYRYVTNILHLFATNDYILCAQLPSYCLLCALLLSIPISRASSSYFFLFCQQFPIFSHFSAKFLFFPIFSQFAVEFFISRFFFRFYFFQCGNICTERAVLWENFSHGVVWVRFSHESLTNVWRSVDLTSPHPG